MGWDVDDKACWMIQNQSGYGLVETEKSRNALILQTS